MENLFFGLGFHTAPFELHFAEEPDYSKLDLPPALLDTFAEMSNSNICILDFYKHAYYYTSKNHLFLCGYTKDDDIELNEDLAFQVIYDNDRNNQLKMKDAACLFFADHSPEEQLKISLYSSHRLKHKNGSVFMVSNQYKPIKFDDNGKMWMTMCISKVATKNIRIETYIEIGDNEERFIFSDKNNAFIPLKKEILSPKEKEILKLSSRGFSIKEISDKKCISESTVKFHRKNILEKLKTDSITEAISYASFHKLL